MKTIIFIFIILLFFSSPEIEAQNSLEKDPKLWEEFKVKKELIEQEIKKNETVWAGEYHMFDDVLTLAPKSGYALIVRRAAFDYIFGTNDVRYTNGKIKLNIEPDSKWQKLPIFSSELIPVLWGERHYLILEQEIIKFVNAINGGYEPGSKSISFGNQFYLRSGDENKPTTGSPDIPERYRDYLLEKPIRAKILEISKSVENLNEYGGKQKVTTVILNVGQNDGVKEGMRFLTISPSRVHEDIIITKVEKDRAEGKVFQTSVYETPVSLKWKLSTSSRDIRN